MGGARFRYALEPVALQRQWALDALLRELDTLNAALAQRRAEHAAVLGQQQAAGQEWRALGSGGQTVQVDRFALLSRYLADRRRQAAETAQAVAALEHKHDGMIEQIALAQRAVDAVEEHRGQMRKEFVRARLSGEFKSADDQWSVMQIVRTNDGD
jgi:hypothetical protein